MRNSLGFKVVAFAVVTLILTIILAVAQELLGIDYSYISLPQWGPGLAALLLGILYFKQSFKNVKLVFPGVLAVCITVPLGLIGVGYLISWALGSAPSITIDNSLLYVIPGSLVGAVGEALGWRSFLQSSLVKGSTIYWPLRLLGRYGAYGM